MDKRSICIIGVGKVGSTLAFEFIEAGFQNVFLIDKYLARVSRIAKSSKKFKYSNRFKKEFINGSDIVIISVHDSVIGSVIKKLQSLKIDYSGKIILHTSGALNSDVFNLLNISKSRIGSFHPIQTFNRFQYSRSKVLEGIYFGIEGGIKARKFQKELCKKFKSYYIEIPKEKKLIYHTACVIASNFLVTYINILSDIIKMIGLKEEKTYKIFEPIIIETLLNISRHGHVKSLTGPYERNDVNTINGHLQSIAEENPLLIPFYISLAKETIGVALKKKSITKAEARELNKVLDKFNINHKF